MQEIPEMQVRYLGLEEPLKKWQPTQVFLPEELHGQKSLVGHSPWDCKESDTTEYNNNLSYPDSLILSPVLIPY